MSSDSDYTDDSADSADSADSDGPSSPSHPPSTSSGAGAASSTSMTAPSGAAEFRPSGPLLSVDLLQSVAGGNDLEVLEDVEIIFSPVCEIANLNRCVNLRSLTLIGVGLRRLSNLACVARSLERLCLPENELTRIEGLYLPNLRELYLHSNQICRIEGLDGCPKLQRLWLADNRVVKLENLHALGDLRELWLQGNRISRVQNLEPLANLESLHLANNRIADFKDLHRLAHLPNLRELSLVDADHGSNPVVRAEGYRQFVLCTLKTVRVLDAEAVTARARQQAEELYVQRVLAFNDRVDQVRRDNERELLAIEARKQRNIANADGLREELQRAFRELEGTVRDGRQRIEAEQRRQLRVRQSNLGALQKMLQELRSQHGAQIERLVNGEDGRMKAEEAWFKSERCKLFGERNAALFLARARPRPNASSPGGAPGDRGRSRGGSSSTASAAAAAAAHAGNVPAIACQDLSEHVPDYRFISAHFRAASTAGRGRGAKSNSAAAAAAAALAANSSSGVVGGGMGAGDGGKNGEGGPAPRKLRVLKVFKMHNAALCNLNRKTVGGGGGPGHKANTGSAVLDRLANEVGDANAKSGVDAERLYMGGSVRQLQHVALHGFGSWPRCNRTLGGVVVEGSGPGGDGGDGDRPIVLYTDPMLAVEASAAAAKAEATPGTAMYGEHKRATSGEGGRKDDGGGSGSSSGFSTENTESFSTGDHAVHTVLLCRLDLGRRHTLYGSRAQALAPSKQLAAQIPPECHTGMVSYGGGGASGNGAFYLVRKEHAHRIIPECYVLAQEAPRKWPGSTRGGGGAAADGAVGVPSLDGAKIEKVLAELTMPASSSGVGKDAQRITAEFERKVLKEVQHYEHRIFQEMDPETAEQLQQSENEVARLRDTLQGLRKQIDSEKGMQERILREFRASFGDNGSSSRSSRSNSLANQASSQRPSSRGGRGDKY